MIFVVNDPFSPDSVLHNVSKPGDAKGPTQNLALQAKCCQRKGDPGQGWGPSGDLQGLEEGPVSVMSRFPLLALALVTLAPTFSSALSSLLQHSSTHPTPKPPPLFF